MLTKRRERLFPACALAALVLFCNAFSAHDNDTWWHIRTGQLIWTSGHIPAVDPFSYTIAGQPWFCFEWLSQLGFFGAYRAAGAIGVMALKTFVALAAFLVVFFTIGTPAWLAAAVLGLAAAVSEGGFLERPIIFDLLLWACLRCETQKPEGPRIESIVCVQALWSNLHGGAALIGASYLFADGLDRARRDGIKALLPAFTGLAATALNPHGWAIARHALTAISFAERRWIADWRPMTEFFSLPGLYAIAGAAAILAGARKRPFESTWLLALLALTLSGQRHLPIFALAAAPRLAESGSRAARRVDFSGVGSGLAVFFVLLGVYWWTHVYVTWGRAFGFGSYEDLSGAAAFLDEQKIAGRMFNQYDAGGALIALAPARPVFIDSRNLEYGPEFVREAVLWKNNWPALAARYRFDYAVLFNRRAGYDCRVLDGDPRWALVYWDDAALVYARRAAARSAFSLLRPNSPSFDWIDAILSGGDAERLSQELDRALVVSHRASEALLMKAYAEARRGRSPQALLDEASQRPFWNPELWSDLASVQEAAGLAEAARASRSRAESLAAAR